MTGWRSEFVETNGVRIHLTRTPPQGPAVVLLHGITDSGLCFRRTAQDLEDRYELFLVDARGHGLSQAPGHSYALQDQAADVIGLIEALGIDRPALIGHSMGGYTAVQAAATRPDLIRGVILEDPPFTQTRFTSEQRRSLAEEWKQGLVQMQTMPLEALQQSARGNNPAFHPLDLEDWARSKIQVDPAAMQAVDDFLIPWQEVLPGLKIPGLLLYGEVERGGIVTPAAAQEIQQMWRQVEIRQIAGTGHSIRREAYLPYLQAVTGFLDQVLKQD
jgi:N-formylmaleamate deformylase